MEVVLAVLTAVTCVNRLAVFPEFPAPPIATHWPTVNNELSTTTTAELAAVVVPVVNPKSSAITVTGALAPNGISGNPVAIDGVAATVLPGAAVVNGITVPDTIPVVAATTIVVEVNDGI